MKKETNNRLDDLLSFTIEDISLYAMKIIFAIAIMSCIFLCMKSCNNLLKETDTQHDYQEDSIDDYSYEYSNADTISVYGRQ